MTGPNPTILRTPASDSTSVHESSLTGASSPIPFTTMNNRTHHTLRGLLLWLLILQAHAADEIASSEELYTGKEYSDAFAMPEDDPALPNVLLIGDSISIGYTLDVRKRLKGQADIFRIPTNGRYASYGCEHLDAWLGNRKWDVIHFNWGLWDICYRNPESQTQGHRDKINGTLTATPEQYRESMEQIVARLKQTNAKLIWCTTTPVPAHEKGRIVGDEIKYNQIASQIMKQNGIAINDLHSHALSALPEIQKDAGDVHFTPTGYSHLAEKVAQSISRFLKD